MHLQAVQYQVFRNSGLPVIFGIFIWGVNILYKGYFFGGGQQVELFPYILYLGDNSLYPHDLYIQSLTDQVFHERLFFSWLLYPFRRCLEWPAFIIHGLTTCFLVLAMVRIFRLYVKQDYWIYTGIFVFFMTLSINTGGHELYYNTLHPSNIGIALGIWALYYFISARYNISAFLLVFATWFHPMIGFQLFLLFIFAIIAANYKNWFRLKRHIPFLLIYIVLGSPYVFLLIYTQNQDLTEHVTSREFADNILYFRLIRHLDPSFYSNTAILMNSCLAVAGLVYFYFRDKKIFFVLTGILLGILIYVTGFYLKIYPLVISWWFRTTIWLKFLGWVALFAFFALFSEILFKQYKKILRGLITTALLLLACFRVFYLDQPAFRNFYENIQLPFLPYSTPEIAISKQIRNHVPRDAVFIHPYSFNALKYYGRVSSWIDYYAYPRRKDYAPVYMRRVNLIYGFSEEDRYPSLKMHRKARQHYLNTDRALLQKLAEKGVTHILTYQSHKLNGLRKIVENDAYVVYKL